MTDDNSETPLREEARQWRRQLIDFVERIRSPLPERAQLSPLQHEQRRVTGGVLLQFFEFIQDSANNEMYPQLADHPLEQRLFLMISDEAGMHAADELMDTDTPQAFCLLKEEWRAFLESPDTDDDEAFTHHYQFWSVWHQNIPQEWDTPQLDDNSDDDYWVHEEGFALADRAGRGAQHLWRWDGENFDLVDEELSSWSS